MLRIRVLLYIAKSVGWYLLVVVHSDLNKAGRCVQHQSWSLSRRHSIKFHFFLLRKGLLSAATKITNTRYIKARPFPPLSLLKIILMNINCWIAGMSDSGSTKTRYSVFPFSFSIPFCATRCSQIREEDLQLELGVNRMVLNGVTWFIWKHFLSRAAAQRKRLWDRNYLNKYFI